MLDHRLDRHDRTQIELKLGYSIRPGERQQGYRVETYIFVPTVLALNKRSYPKERFYEDTATFIRMTTPKVPLRDLSDLAVIKPWAGPILEEIGHFTNGNGGNEAIVIRGLKLMACLFKGALRDQRGALRHRLQATWTSSEDMKSAIHAFSTDIQAALATMRSILNDSAIEQVPQPVRDACSAVDEYTSLLAEEAATNIVVQCEGRASNDDLLGVLDSLRDLAIAEYLHRRAKGYQSYAFEGDRNEYLPHRWRVLKRYVSSALYLDVSREEPGSWVADTIAMTAAATAMLFATIVALWSTERFGANLSMAFVGAMVISYVIKDRIKELGKRHLGQRIRSLLPDQHLTIRSADTEEPLGTCKESFHITRVRKISRDVQALRYADLASHDAIEGRPENVLCYVKEVDLSSKTLLEHLEGTTGLTDIVRLNFQPMLARMDDPWEVYRYIHPTTRALQDTRCARVYHVNVVLRMTATDGETVLERVRVVVDKKGIQRVEPVSPGAAKAVSKERDGPLPGAPVEQPATAKVCIDDE